MLELSSPSIDEPTLAISCETQGSNLFHHNSLLITILDNPLFDTMIITSLTTRISVYIMIWHRWHLRVHDAARLPVVTLAR